MNHQEFIKSALKQLTEEGKHEAIATYFSANYVAHANNKKYEGHNFLTRWNKQFQAAFQNPKVVKLKFLSRENQLITWQRALSATHIKSLRGIPASHKKVIWNEMVVSRFEDGKIAEEWLVSELAGELMLKLPRK